MPRRDKKRQQIPPALRVPVAEQLLIDELPAIREMRILSTSLGRGQFAGAAARQIPGALVTLHELDIHLADEARRFLEQETNVEGGAGEGGVRVVCSADFPETDFDLAALPVDFRGEAELTRELLQAAHTRLVIGGRLLAATGNAEDQWLHDELRKLFPKVTRRPSETGVLYLATKHAPLKKLKQYEARFAFRDRDRLIQAVSRPGVFNHRGLDAGARALVNTMQVAEGARVLDLGCGSGVVAFAAALRAPGVAVVAVDSHARAIDCTERGAAQNGLTNLRAILNAEGETGEPGSFDLVVGNPPYYSDYRIAEIFLQGARKALRPGGTLLIVTKAVAWYEERLPELFDQVRRNLHKNYSVLEAKQRQSG
jgi:16S rRNA (guanine1207-N2)-methyltransferase